MKYNPKKHNRQSIRLKGYDYSRPGAYFITICTQNRACLFGEIVEGKTILNDAGQMIEKWYHELENKYPEINCDEHITMPNHFHCIIKISDISPAPVRMAPRGHRAPIAHPHPDERDAHAGASLRGIPGDISTEIPPPGRASVFEIMDWFKTMTTNEYIRGAKNNNWPRFEKRVWQLRYWDHIVRNELELSRIRQYIRNNPLNWKHDRLCDGKNNSVMENFAEYENELWMV